MNAQRGKLVSGGRIQLPVDVRRQLGLSDGDTVLIEVVDGEVHLRPLRDAVRRIQQRIRPYAVEGRSVVDELISERRASSGDE